MKNLVTLLSGMIFSIGLGLSGMTQPHIVKGFLDIFGAWDPRLLGVMAGAISVHAIAYRIIMKRSSPVLDVEFKLPTKKDIDARLILGSLIFGLGWGWAGICPGPGIVALASGDYRIILFISALLTGMMVFLVFEKNYLK